jgi:hypothetical protein
VTNHQSGSAQRRIVSPQRRIHILTGDRTGGGHRHGAGKGGSEFPASWSDQDIIDAIEDVANDTSATTIRGRNGSMRLIASRNSVSITVVLDGRGQIVTGYPTT